MASTINNPFPIDPTKAAKYPVFLSQDLLEGNGNARQHALIQCMCDSLLIFVSHLLEAYPSIYASQS